MKAWTVAIAALSAAAQIVWGLFSFPTSARVFYVTEAMLCCALAPGVFLPGYTVLPIAWRCGLFMVAMYTALTQLLIATCGAWWYFLVPDDLAQQITSTAMCERGRGWWWLPLVLVAMIFGAIHVYQRQRRSRDLSRRGGDRGDAG